MSSDSHTSEGRLEARSKSSTTTDKEVNNKSENYSCMASPPSWAEDMPPAWGSQVGCSWAPWGAQSNKCPLIWAVWVNNKWCHLQFMMIFIQSAAEVRAAFAQEEGDLRSWISSWKISGSHLPVKSLKPLGYFRKKKKGLTPSCCD